MSNFLKKICNDYLKIIYEKLFLERKLEIVPQFIKTDSGGISGNCISCPDFKIIALAPISKINLYKRPNLTKTPIAKNNIAE